MSYSHRSMSLQAMVRALCRDERRRGSIIFGTDANDIIA
jgi:hypothetical protein